MDRGTDSINNLLNYIIFSIVPTIIDIIVAIVYFIAAFNIWFGVIVFITMTLYISKCQNDKIPNFFLNRDDLFSSSDDRHNGVAYQVPETHELGR